MVLRIANGAGFLGDSTDAPRRLLESASCDYLTLEYLAELTMSILARAREKNPQWGFARDFLQVLQSIVPHLQSQSGLRVVTNAGGVNPRSCVQATAEMLVRGGIREHRIAVIEGDDLASRLELLRKDGWNFPNFETGESLSEPDANVVCANAYLGAAPIVQALKDQAQIVITGRVADASLTLGPCWQHFGWQQDNWDLLAGASVAGHLIECGAQVTGGYSTRWRNLELENVGYPIAEVNQDGTCIITKPQGSGGIVDQLAVAQQLVYEIGDPRHYLTPDVDVDFTGVRLMEVGKDRVQVSGARGAPSPSTYKVSLAYRAGFVAVGQLLVAGRDCLDKAHECARIIRQKLLRLGASGHQLSIEVLGTAEASRMGAWFGSRENSGEIVLRMAFRDRRREFVEHFARELAPLITSGPAGLAGYASGRPEVQPVLAYWPTTIPRELVEANVQVRTAVEWSTESSR